ncbi:MAG: pyridoxal phosphate-dependent aminotransferase [Lachnospiraceae bacterium]|nr:pyridoxal phosphate-dependent aminotransferase [Lachnospiraceae bacterium]
MSLTLSEKAKHVKPSSTLVISARAKELKAEGRDIVGFGAGEPDFNTPENICDAAVQAIREGFTKYTPASGTKELKEAVSRKFKNFNKLDYAPDQIVISNGGKHSLTNVFSALLNPGDEVIIPAPYWLSYPEMVKLQGGVPVHIYGAKENGYRITPDQLQSAITKKTKAFVLCNPSNPTGVIYGREDLEKFAEVIVKNDIYCISDEMYENLLYTGEPYTSIASLGQEIYDRTITCSGLSKGYSMTGWRVGYTGSSKEIASLMGAVQSHSTSNVNSIAQKAALEALNGPQDSVEKMRQAFDERRKYIYKRICAMPYVDAAEPQGAFYLFCDCTEALKRSYKGQEVGTTGNLATILLNDFDVAVVPCPDFGYPNHIRLSYAISLEQIEKGMDRIEKFLNGLK